MCGLFILASCLFQQITFHLHPTIQASPASRYEVQETNRTQNIQQAYYTLQAPFNEDSVELQPALGVGAFQ